MGKAVRVTVNLAPDVADTLKTLAAYHGTTIGETLRRAISLLKYHEEEQIKGNIMAIVIDPDGKREIREVKFLG